MKRGETGVWEPSVGAGEACLAFIPQSLPPQPPIDMSEALREKWDAAHVALGRLDSIATLLTDRDLFLYSYVRQEAVLSSQIEGTQSSLTDLLIYESHALPGSPLDDVQEVSCYVNALYKGIERVREGWPIATPLVLELHAALLHHGRGASKAPGEWRRTQNWLGGHSPSTAVFVPPPPQRVLDCWSGLEKFINNVPMRTAPLLRTALVHVQFETIHPFLDGNSRLGRLLIPLMLMKEGLLSEPLLYLSLYFKKHRDAYYDLLQSVRETGDWEAWLDFFADAVVQTATQAVATVRALHELVQADSARVRELGRISGSALPVLLCLARRPIANASQVQQETKLSLPTVNNALRALQKASIVGELTGAQRGRLFVYNAYLDTLVRIEA
jgi:Fic family protein